MHRSKSKIFLIVIFSLIIIVGVFICNFYISFVYGDFQGFIAEQRSLPGDKDLAHLRSDAVKQLTEAQNSLGTLNGLVLYEKTYSDKCSKGTHGWKRTDPYAYVCSYRLTYYYGTNRDYKEILLDLEKYLDQLDWKIENRTPKLPTITEVMGTNSEDIYLVELPYYHKKASGNNQTNNICTAPYCNSFTLAINGFYGYGLHWSKSNNEPDPFGFGIALYQEIYKDESNKSPEEIFNRITSSGQNAIMFAISKNYFWN